MRKIMRKKAKGQTMAIIGLVLALGVLIGLVAIAVDGGSALLQRRNMQNSSRFRCSCWGPVDVPKGYHLGR